VGVKVLNKLILLGKEKGFFDEKTLGNLECSCCPASKILVIDYDKTKEKLTKYIELQDSKSTDAIKIISEINQIDFLEMKDVRFFSHPIKKIQSDLNRKIKNSFSVLFYLVHSRDFQFSEQEKQQYDEVEKNYFIVVNIEDQDPVIDRAVTLSYLAIKRFITNIPESPLENFKKSRLFSCREIDAYYKELDS
jgi:hypothetical protein